MINIFVRKSSQQVLSVLVGFEFPGMNYCGNPWLNEIGTLTQKLDSHLVII